MTPNFLSLEFHFRFFPALLWKRLRTGGERGGTGFTLPLEFPVLFVVCCVLVIIGLPGAIDKKSVVGWIMSGIGLLGILFLIINSLTSRKDALSYDNFLPGIFFFFVLLGITAGIFTGSLNHSFRMGFLAVLGGLIVGYLIGIYTGLWFQRFGWLASIINGMAWLGVIGMIVLDMVLLAGAL